MIIIMYNVKVSSLFLFFCSVFCEQRDPRPLVFTTLAAKTQWNIL